MGKPGLLLSKTAPSLPSLTDGPAERAVEFKRQELAVAKLLATIRTIVTRASARSSAEMTVLRNAVQRVARDLGDPSLVAEAEKMEAAWTAVLDLERSLAEQKSEPAMLTAKRSVEVCKQEEAAVVKRILNSQATTRRMESERNAAQTKLATLKTDMEELYRNRVTHLLEVCEEQDEQLDTVQTELNQELERRVALVDTTGAKAERMELENADIETRLAVVYQQAMVLEEEAAQLEAAIKALEVEIGDNKAQRKAVEKGHKEMMKSLSHQELHSVELLAEAEHEAEKIAKTRALEAEKQQEAFEHMVSLLEAAISAAEDEARQGREKIKEAQVAEAKAREKAEGIEARLEEFAELFAQLEEREAKLEDLRGEVQAAKATLAGHKAETKAAEDERDDYLDRKARFCKRRVAVPDSPEEQCAWLVDWVRNLKSKLLELQREKVVCDERSEAAEKGLLAAEGIFLANLRRAQAKHGVAMIFDLGFHAAEYVNQPECFPLLEEEAARIVADASAASTAAHAAAAADLERAETEAYAAVRAAELRRRQRLEDVTGKVAATIGAATAALAEKKRELDLRLVEWRQQAGAFSQQRMNHAAAARDITARQAEVETEVDQRAARLVSAQAVAAEQTAIAEQVRGNLEETEKSWVRKLGGLRDRLFKEKQEAETELGFEIRDLTAKLGTIPQQLAAAQARIDDAHAQLDAQRAKQAQVRVRYDAQFESYSALQDELLRASGDAQLARQLDDADSTLQHLATRSLQKEFIAQEENLRELTKHEVRDTSALPRLDVSGFDMAPKADS